MAVEEVVEIDEHVIHGARYGDLSGLPDNGVEIEVGECVLLRELLGQRALSRA
jgi:hypothetical protein